MTPQYWAGFFDGEGNIQICYRRLTLKGGTFTAFELRVSVSQKDKTPLLLLQEQYGGGINTAKTGCSMLSLSGLNGRTFLRAIAPFLIVKKGEAEVALEFAALQEANPAYAKGHKGAIAQTPELIVKKIALYDKINAVRREKGFSSNRRPKPWAN